MQLFVEFLVKNIYAFTTRFEHAIAQCTNACYYAMNGKYELSAVEIDVLWILE